MTTFSNQTSNQRNEAYAPSPSSSLSDSQSQKMAQRDTGVNYNGQAKAEIRFESGNTYQGNTNTGTSGYAQPNGYSPSNNISSGAESWTMKAPEGFDLRKQGAHAGKMIEASKKRSKNLSTLAEKIILEESEYINSEKFYLDQAKVRLENIKDQVRQSVNQDDREAEEIKIKMDNLAVDKKTRSGEAQIANAERTKLESDMQNTNGQISSLNQKKKEIAARIDPHELSHCKLQEKAALHNVFAWVIVVVYGEQESTYYWDNFKQAAFVKDKGQDFKARIRGLKYKMNSEQILITQRVVKGYDAIRNDVVNHNNFNKSLNELIEYIKVMDQINFQLEILKNLENKQEKAIQEAEIKTSNLEEITVQTDGYQSRLSMIDQFNKSFNAIFSSLEKVQSMCQVRATSQAGLAEKMKQDLSTVKSVSQLEEPEEASAGSPVKATENEHKHVHANVKSQMRTQETEFVDSGKRAQSCQECTIF